MREAKAVKIEYWHDDTGKSPFEKWYNNLDHSAQRAVANALRKRRLGNTGNSDSVGGGIHELKSGQFRIYYGIDGVDLIILLGGGTKQRQQTDIDEAVSRWRHYKRQKMRSR